ncbi:hypothetical protein B0H13DRAFT_1882121 [Mycena leptocephala]|nr:hypothetical protein B0H13DRAFT_1882121 [Mycena leptocephala]
MSPVGRGLSRQLGFSASFPLTVMSLLVEGFPVYSVGFAATQRTVLSRRFYDSLQRRLDRLLFTTTIAPYGTCSTVLHCDVSSSADFDVLLGHDWASLLRDHLITLGHRLSSNLDTWHLFLTMSTNTHAAPPEASTAPELAGSQPPSNSLTSRPPKRSRASSGIKVRQYVPPTGKFSVEQGASFKSSSSSIRREDVEGYESLAELLLSTDNEANIFVMPPKPLIKLLNSHHISKPQDLTIAGARHALLAHLLTGVCIATCDPAFRKDHSCRCKHYCSLYSTQQAQSFAVLSILISASEDRLPDFALNLTAECLGLEADERSVILRELNHRRRKLAREHQSSHTARTLFENFDTLNKGTLLSIAQAHGIVLDHPTSESLRNAISEHVGMGKCITHEGFAPFLGCSSLESEFPPSTDVSSCDDPSVRLQIQILRQLMPVLKLNPLRRLLELHDVSYVESDRAKKLRQLLKGYLVRLRSGKYPEHQMGMEGTKRRQRAKESARLRKEWPQVVPAHLKTKLLANFNMEISQETLAVFTPKTWTLTSHSQVRPTPRQFPINQKQILPRPLIIAINRLIWISSPFLG